MRSRPLPFLALTAALTPLACGSSPPAPPTENPPTPQQVETTFTEPGLDSRVVVLVVDDSPSDAAAQLRKGVARALETSLQRWSTMETESPLGLDPAAWHPAHWSIVVVRPSATGSARIVGPSDLPGLAIRTDQISPANIENLAGAAAAAIDGFVADPSAPYRPLEAASATIALLTGARPPADAHESAALASVTGPQPFIELSIATTRDDDSPLPVSQYPAPAQDQPGFGRVSLLLPLATPGEACSGKDFSTPRLAAWSPHQDEPGPFAWPCDDASITKLGLLYTTSPDYSPYGFCASGPVQRRSSGSVGCVVQAQAPDLDACPVERGWTDPRDADGVRRPRFVEGAAGKLRVCEITELTGKDGDACRESLACTGCASGFCQTDVPELERPCKEPSAHPVNLRFVGGAVAGAGATFHVTCDLAP